MTNFTTWTRALEFCDGVGFALAWLSAQWALFALPHQGLGNWRLTLLGQPKMLRRSEGGARLTPTTVFGGLVAGFGE